MAEAPDDHATPAPRPPQPFVVHWLVDSAVAFLVIVLPAWFVGIPIVASVAAATLIGLAFAPTTLRREAEALDARRLDDAGEP